MSLQPKDSPKALRKLARAQAADLECSRLRLIRTEDAARRQVAYQRDQLAGIRRDMKAGRPLSDEPYGPAKRKPAARKLPSSSL